jgi:hypothetical protein
MFGEVTRDVQFWTNPKSLNWYSELESIVDFLFRTIAFTTKLLLLYFVVFVFLQKEMIVQSHKYIQVLYQD